MRTNTENFLYEEIPAERMCERIKAFNYVLGRCFQYLDISRKGITINIPMVHDLFKRIDQRADYYLFFHSKADNPVHMSQAKAISLLAFWVVKYKPHMMSLPESHQIYMRFGCTINELYAAYIIASFVVAKSSRPDISSYITSPDVLKNITYNLMHRDLSKESIIFYVNSLLGEV